MPEVKLPYGLNVTDLTGEMPVKIGRWREGKGLLGLAIHHEGSPRPEGSDVFTIARYHVKNLGWDHIGYHWVIERDGTIYMTLHPKWAGYHAGYTVDERGRGDDLSKFPFQDKQYYNDYYWAVCIIGNDPTAAQYKSLIALSLAIKTSKDSLQIVGHKELPGKATECPGPKTDMNYIRSEVARYMDPSAKPGPGDDSWARKYPTWRDAAISVKGAADRFGDELVAARKELEDSLRLLEAVRTTLDLRLKSIKELTGG